MRSLSKLDPIVFKEKNRLFTEFKGSLTENFILQGLIAQKEHSPYYWVSEGKAEIDFAIQHKNEIIPIEVKSDINVKSRSLNLYHKKYEPKLRIRYSLKNLSYSDGLLNIPLFLVDFTEKFIELCLRYDS